MYKIRKDFLRLILQTQEGFRDPKNLSTQYQKSRKNLRLVIFREKEQLADILELIKQAYSMI